MICFSVPQPAASSSQRNATPGPSGVARQNTEPILLSSDEESEDDEVIKNAQVLFLGPQSYASNLAALIVADTQPAPNFASLSKAALKKMQADLAKSQAALDAAKAKRAARKGVNVSHAVAVPPHLRRPSLTHRLRLSLPARPWGRQA